MGSAAKATPLSRCGFAGLWVLGSLSGVLLVIGCQAVTIGFGNPDHPFPRSGGDALSLSTSSGNEGPTLAHAPAIQIPPVREERPARSDWGVPWKPPTPREVEPDLKIKPFEEEPGERDEPPVTPLETGALSPEDLFWCRLLVTLAFEDEESPPGLPETPRTTRLPSTIDLARD